MPKFNCSYAYDVPYYLDFTVEAASEEEAQAKMNKALADGVFDEHDGDAQPCYENADHARTFVSGPTRTSTPSWTSMN